MNWVKLGSRTINLDLVISYHEEYDRGEGLWIELYCVGDEDEPSYEFSGDEAHAFKKFMDSSGSVKVADRPGGGPGGRPGVTSFIASLDGLFSSAPEVSSVERAAVGDCLGPVQGA